MILIIGGREAGKRQFAASLGYAPGDMTPDPGNQTAPVLYGLEGLEPLPPLGALLKRQVVICDEIGCGVIPLDRHDRDRRDAVGRLCCALAQKAEAVYRVSCGLGMRLK